MAAFTRHSSRLSKPRGVSRRKQAGYSGVGLLRALMVRPFTIRDLFRSGQEGFRYEVVTPAQNAIEQSMYQDSTGVTPAALEQPVGFMRDKRLGDARDAAVTLQTFGQLIATATDNGDGTYTFSAGGSGRFNYALAELVQNSFYEVSFTVISIAGGSVLSDWCDSGVITIAAVSGQEFRYIAKRTAGALDNTYRFVDVQAPAGSAITITQPVVRRVPGNHSTQATAPSRPKLTARVNLFDKTEFPGGVTDAPTRAGLLSAAVMSGYAGALAFGHDGATATYAYKSGTTLAVSTLYKVSVDVVMDDGGAPSFSGAHNSASNDFALVAGNTPGIPSAVSLGNGVYRCSALITTTATVVNNHGVVKYATNSARTFKVTAYDVRTAGDAALAIPSYQRVNTATDYDTVGFPLGEQFDGVDDFRTGLGGGGTVKFFFCALVKVNGGAGTARTLWSDAGGTNGRIVRLDAADKLRLSAADGAVSTGVFTAASASVGETHVMTVWDDGVSLCAQIDQGAIASTARPVVAAGSTTITECRANGAASEYAPVTIFDRVFMNSECPDAATRAKIQRSFARKVGLTL